MHVYIYSDKGNKKGNKNLTKYIYRYDKESQNVNTFLLDVGCMDEDTGDIADTVHHSLIRIFGVNNVIKLHDQCTIVEVA